VQLYSLRRINRLEHIGHMTLLFESRNRECDLKVINCCVFYAEEDWWTPFLKAMGPSYLCTAVQVL